MFEAWVVWSIALGYFLGQLLTAVATGLISFGLSLYNSRKIDRQIKDLLAEPPIEQKQ